MDAAPYEILLIIFEKYIDSLTHSTECKLCHFQKTDLMENIKNPIIYVCKTWKEIFLDVYDKKLQNNHAMQCYENIRLIEEHTDLLDQKISHSFNLPTSKEYIRYMVIDYVKTYDTLDDFDRKIGEWRVLTKMFNNAFTSLFHNPPKYET